MKMHPSPVFLTPKSPRRFSRAVLALLCTLCCLSLQAEDAPERRDFDIPAGQADKSLKVFSEQAGRGIIAATEVVEGVKTNAVHGKYTSLGALERMLAGTGLVPVQDKRGQAFSVKRAAPSDARRPDAAGAAVPPLPPAPAGDPAAKDVVVLNAFVVTGSNIPTAANATDVPIVVLGQKQLEQTGLTTNMLEILRKRIPAFGGRSNTGNANGSSTDQATAGGSQIALRNLPTLILINGRRVATSSFNAINGKSFVDINQIPAAAVERVETLTDGASAIYGSDAIGGVVNFILKSDYHGAEVGARYGVAKGGYAERSGYVVAGFGQNGINLTVTASWAKTDPLRQQDRPFIATNFQGGTSFPGYADGNYLAPGLTSPSQKVPVGTKAGSDSEAALVGTGAYLAAGDAAIPDFNLAPYVSLLLRQEQRAAIANFNADLASHEKLTLFGDLLYSVTRSSNQTTAVFSNTNQTTVPAGSPYNPLTVDFPNVTVGTTDTPMQTRNQTVAWRGTIGFRGKINDHWNWEVGYLYNASRVEQRLTNNVFLPNLDLAIAGGYDASGTAIAGGRYSKVHAGFDPNGPLVVQPALDPFARSGVDPASLAHLYGTEVIKTRGALASLDAKIVGTPFSLPAGRVGFAAGVARRKETLGATPDGNSWNASTDPAHHNWSAGIAFDYFSTQRTIDSAFAELRVPVTGPSWNFPGARALDVTLAGRVEKYSDYGKSKVPKIGVRWQPFDEQVVLRFSYAQSFLAPSLFDEFGPATFGPDFSAAPDGRFVALGVNQAVNFYSGNGNNPELKTADAWSRSVGVVLSPKGLKPLTVSIDYSNVYMKGYPSGLDDQVNLAASVNALGSASPYFGLFSVKGAPGQPGATRAPLAAPGGLAAYITNPAYAGDLYLLDHKSNAGGVQARAIDVNLEYEVPTGAAGKFTFSTTGTYTLSSLVQASPGKPIYEFAGYSTNGTVFAGSEPKVSLYSTIGWSHRNWDVLVGNTYMSSMTDIPPYSAPAVFLAGNPATKVATYTAWDFQATYTIPKHTANALLGRLRGLQLTAGVNNVFDRMPPAAPRSQPSSANYNNVDVSTYSPIGRLIFISATKKF